ncbi:uncharacterized protein PHALS_13273 [Plasmopara halstedii]|uniref:Uncharacterized protein n=1 Tax=Plasmopara halstedii TaxID=4781 RepID=A0A0N7L620_PLAHL|nr:uncharacterized protein PHALS_13273 [Plasmopara halstedii]CEG43051.1 hypothetical protein PHALS_13273 [Plasmopara halstedii]|eukprot:XP_024579420.1 hypothetical protein PHALS_13273 [Plasmopara halstedii]
MDFCAMKCLPTIDADGRHDRKPTLNINTSLEPLTTSTGRLQLPPHTASF